MSDRFNFWSRYLAVEKKMKRNIYRPEVINAFKNLFCNMADIRDLPLNLKYELLEIMKGESQNHKVMKDFFFMYKNYLNEKNKSIGLKQYETFKEFYNDGHGNFNNFSGLDDSLGTLEKVLA